MFVIIACIFFVLWLVGVTVFKVTKGIVHLILLIAVIAIVVHFVRGG